MERLDVYLCGQLVGALVRDGVTLSFRYLPTYLSRADASPISGTLPLSETPYAERDVMAFFSNLLPDESVRERLAAILHLDVSDTFGLLREIGGECAGAIAFWEPGKAPEADRPPEYRVLEEAEAVDILEHLQQRPLGIDDEFRGISGAGAQDKLIACLDEATGRISLPLHGTPSTHIIKPQLDRFPESVENEHLLMQLAGRCGLETAPSSVLELGGRRYYVTRRYDREIGDGKVTRLHQEDFCQLLKCRPEIKYQDQGGPSVVECVNLLRTQRLPAADVLSLVERMIFNFIVGNGDAHGKNFSVLYRGGRPRLAPCYDLICTSVYPAVGRRMAMKFDGQYDFRWITLGKICRTFARAGIGERAVTDIAVRIAERVRAELPALLNQENASHPAAIYHDIAQGIHRRLSQLEKTPPSCPKCGRGGAMK